MHAASDQDSTGTLSALEQYDAEECRSSEVTWLPVTWQSLEPWQISLHSRTAENAFWSLPDNELLPRKVTSEPPLVGRDTQYIEDLSWVRVEQAKNLLMNANYSIAEIASELGFLNPLNGSTGLSGQWLGNRRTRIAPGCRPVRCPRFSVSCGTDILKGGHQT